MNALLVIQVVQRALAQPAQIAYHVLYLFTSKIPPKNAYPYAIQANMLLLLQHLHVSAVILAVSLAPALQLLHVSRAQGVSTWMGQAQHVFLSVLLAHLKNFPLINVQLVIHHARPAQVLAIPNAFHALFLNSFRAQPQPVSPIVTLISMPYQVQLRNA